MEHQGYSFSAAAVTKFHNTIYVNGWFYHPSDSLTAVELDVPGTLAQLSAVDLPFDLAPTLIFGTNRGFRVQALRCGDGLPQDCAVIFRTKNGWVARIRLSDLCADRMRENATSKMSVIFRSEIAKLQKPRILDIGGRARSGVARKSEFPNAEYVCLDVLPGENVDIVGDAHELSKYFEPESFDAVYSVSVFEHLIMPWKAALEINKVLKGGGIGLVHSHQTLGLHDMPWDFFRFSDFAWDALFNSATGFEIVEKALDSGQYILPEIFHPGKVDAEDARGFEGSAVMFRKISAADSKLAWPVRTHDVVASLYPIN